MPFEPGFLSGPAGKLFAVYYPVVGATGSAPALVHVPAFADEMNKSRHVVARASRALASGGTAVLVLDPFGTGDSEGDFGDASWTQWLDDIAIAVDMLRGKGHTKIGLWGLRAGCLLAVDAVARTSSISRLVLWAPVPKGEQFLAQFLRLRVASASLRGGQKESVKDLRQKLANGDSVEVAGYCLNGALTTPLAAADMMTNVPRIGMPVFWYDVVAAQGVQTSVAVDETGNRWSEAGVDLRRRTVICAPFWSTQELVDAPELSLRTCTDLANCE